MKTISTTRVLCSPSSFIKVVDTGSLRLRRAFQSIGQPAVSKTLAQLEERLGVRLLLHSTRGLTPTAAGMNFYERARRTIEEADEAARGTTVGPSGHLRVSAPG
jgi:DNA-binding transcriptional LysR family regulator